MPRLQTDVSTWGVSARRRVKRQREAEAAKAKQILKDDDDEYTHMYISSKSRKRRRSNPKTASKNGEERQTWFSLEISGLLGEAHAEIIAGNEERAIGVLGEVVKRCPEAAEAYSTLSAIYENRWIANCQVADLARSQQLALVAAHLLPECATSWRRVALVSMELGQACTDPTEANEAESNALDALNRVLKLEPFDFASVADRATLQAKLGDAANAIIQLKHILQEEEQKEHAVFKAQKLALYLVLAEITRFSSSSNNAIATEALRQCFKQTENAIKQYAGNQNNDITQQEDTTPELREALISNNDHDENEFVRLVAIRDRCALELARIEYNDGRYKLALQILTRTVPNFFLEKHFPKEPLDLCTQRGACLARLGKLDEAQIAWNPLVFKVRELCQTQHLLTIETKEEQCAEYAHLLELCIDAAMDQWKKKDASSPQNNSHILRSLLDGLARIYAAWNHKDDEARTHARLVFILRATGAKLAAEKRLTQAMNANPEQPLVLARRVDMCNDPHTLHPLLYVYRRIAEASILAQEYKDDELEAWTALAFAFGRDVQQNSTQKLNSTARVLALGLSIFAESWSGRMQSRRDAIELGKCAVRLAVPTGVFSSTNDALKKTYQLDASNLVLAERVQKLAASCSSNMCRADMLSLIVHTLIQVNDTLAARHVLSDALAIARLTPDLAPVPVTEIIHLAQKYQLVLFDQQQEHNKLDNEKISQSEIYLKLLISAAAKAAIHPDIGATTLANAMTSASKFRCARVNAALCSLDSALAVISAPELAPLTSAALPRTHLALDRLRHCQNSAPLELSRTAALLDLAKRGAPIDPPSGAGLMQGGCSNNRHALVIASACAFDHYSRIRSALPEHNTEISYNLARFLQDADLLAYALPLYQRILDHDGEANNNDYSVPFRRLVAFNLLVGYLQDTSSTTDNRHLKQLLREGGPLAIHLDDELNNI